MRAISLFVLFALAFMASFESVAIAQFRGEVIDGSACTPSVPFRSPPPVGGFVSSQGQLLFGPVTAVCTIVMGNHSLTGGTTLSWNAKDLKVVFVDFAAHTSGARITARTCFRQMLSLVNFCGPSATFTTTSATALASLTLFPPTGVAGPFNGAVIVVVDPSSTFTLLDVNPFWF